jgi:hypothetical protein
MELMVYGKSLGMVRVSILTIISFMISGPVEPGFRPKRYKYKLLDSIDSPYAAFRFFCRPHG